MKPRKGMTARAIVDKLESDLRRYEKMRDDHARHGNSYGFENCAAKALYLEVLLHEIAE